MRIRLPFAGVFFLLLLLAGYVGLTSMQLNVYVDDKLLHFITFFLLTGVFYWIVDTTRRRTLHLTLVACIGLGVGSEFLQELIPNNDRHFDIYDIGANLVGSLAAVGLCTFYHMRMLEKKRARKQYTGVPGEDPENNDLELGEGVGLHEEGVTAEERPTLEEEVDNWDENAEDPWDDEDRLPEVANKI